MSKITIWLWSIWGMTVGVLIDHDISWSILIVPDRSWPDDDHGSDQWQTNSNYWHSTKFLFTKFKDNNQRFAISDTKTKVFINFWYNEFLWKIKLTLKMLLMRSASSKIHIFMLWPILIDPDQSWHQRSGSWSILTVRIDQKRKFWTSEVVNELNLKKKKRKEKKN